MSVGERQAPGASPGHLNTRARRERSQRTLSPPARASLAIAALFIALTCWWVSQDRSLPYSDAAVHLITAFRFHDLLESGDLLGPFTFDYVYPPLTPFVGALGIFVGGRTVAAPVVAENLVYVPLLAFGVHLTAQRAFRSPAGPLAVLFALGSPLIAEQFHVFMIDAPLAAVVAITVWLIVASDRFRHTGYALAAGAVVGLGLISKQSMPLYLAGFVVIVLCRGGWRNWRGVAAFALAALAVGAPWYLYHASSLHEFTEAAGGGYAVPILAKPPLLSAENLEWYFWALANGLLFVPLLAFAIVGVVHAAVGVARSPAVRASIVPELLGGLTGAWIALTVLTHKDVRYAMPLMVFIAVLGTGWIVQLPSALRRLAIVALALAVTAATLGATFGVGARSEAILPANREAPNGEGVPPLHHLTLYSNHNYMVSGPRNGGDLLALFKDLRREGVHDVVWAAAWAPYWYVDFNHHGLLAFARIARLNVLTGTIDLPSLRDDQAVLIAEEAPIGRARPCVRLSMDRSLWIRLGNPQEARSRDFCPRFDPPVYGP